MPALTVSTEDLNLPSFLDDWRWLLKTPHDVLLITAMGSAFVTASDGAVHFLDTLEGTLSPVAPTRAAFMTLMDRRAFDPSWFNPDMLELKATQHVLLEPGQCYCYTLPPVLGGSFDSANVRPIDIAVHFSMAGQLHRQLQGHPPGFQITGLRFTHASPAVPKSGGLLNRLQRWCSSFRRHGRGPAA